MKHINRTIKTSLGVLVLLTIFALVSDAAAQTGPTFDSATYFGDTGNERGTGIAIADGSLYVSGITGTGSDSEGLVVEYALPPVSPEWFNTWPGVWGGDRFNGIAVSGEGVYLAGCSHSQTVDLCGGKEWKAILVKFPVGGVTPTWFKPTNFFPYRGGEWFDDVATDGSFIYAVGSGESYGWGPNAMVLYKYDTSGNVIKRATEPGLNLCDALWYLDHSLWCPCFLYQSVGYSRSSSVIVHNGYIYVVGLSRLTGLGEDSVSRPFLSKFDSDLDRIWKQRPTNFAGSFNGVTACAGTIYAVGYTYTLGVPDSQDYLIQKYDEAGNLLWTNISGGPDSDILTGVVGLGDRLFAVGYTKNEGAGGTDAVILEIDPETGETLSTTLFGGAEDDIANGVATDGADIYVVGQTASFGAGGDDLVLLRYTTTVQVALEKEITSGPDVDEDGEIDVVVEVGQSSATEYDFDITYVNLDEPEVLVVDTVPAEWVVTEVAGNPIVDSFSDGPQPDGNGGTGTVEVFPANRRNPSKSATKIHWWPDPTLASTINVVVQTRQSPGRKNIKFAPTSCGALYLNEDGAAAFELDPETGQPLRDPDTGEKLPPILESNPLCLAAVDDFNGDGVIVRDGSGDEDGDGVTDFAEACLLGTDPCNSDTDGDGVPDGNDPDPLDPEVF